MSLEKEGGGKWHRRRNCGDMWAGGGPAAVHERTACVSLGKKR
jgi:hypothetical protein